MAVGMLKWRGIDNTDLASPLVLVPVTLASSGSKRVPTMKAAEDDAVINPVLQIELEKLGIDLPSDESVGEQPLAVQVELIRKAVSRREGWSVDDAVVVSIFSFFKEAMVRDLTDNEERILAHPIVQAIGTSDPTKQSHDLRFDPVDPNRIDEEAPPEQIPTVLDADSSQRAAILEAVRGRSFVMDGPPGTGKSQTIANMIGALLHNGKTVLFVSEKAAALDVVRNRLESVGLLPYLFELHSAKSNRREVAQSLGHALDMKPHIEEGMTGYDRDQARQKRQSLSAYSEAVNEIREPLGLSLHTVLGKLSALQDAHYLPEADPPPTSLSFDAYQDFLDTADRLSRNWRPAEQGSSFLWKDVLSRTSLSSTVARASYRLSNLVELLDSQMEMRTEFHAEDGKSVDCMVTLLHLQHESRPDGVPGFWLSTGNWDLVQSAQTDLESLVETLRKTAADFEASVVRSRVDFPQIGSPSPSQQPFDLAALLRLTSADDKPEATWFKCGLDTVAQAISDLRSMEAGLSKAELEASAFFTPEVLDVDIHGLSERMWSPTGWLWKLSSQYRADKKLLTTVLADQVAVKEGMAHLELATEWATAAVEFERVSEQVGSLLGGYWNGRQTDWDAASRALDLAERAKSLIELWNAAKAAHDALDDSAERFQKTFESLYQGSDTNLPAVHSAIQWAEKVRSACPPPLSETQLQALENSAPIPGLADAKSKWDDAKQPLLEAFNEPRKSELASELDRLEDARLLLDKFKRDEQGREQWFRFLDAKERISSLGLGDAVADAVNRPLPSDQVKDALHRALLQSWVQYILDTDERLQPLDAAERDELVANFKELDRHLVHSASKAIVDKANQNRPQRVDLGEQDLIRREAMKKKRHKPVRELIAGAKNTILAIKPCFMMSPLAVSHYLPADIVFDTVIFDEASQVLPSDAVNCIYRGKALILAGDDKQLPPTQFFERQENDEDESTDVGDFQSVLELAKASGGFQNLGLRWHYRSQDDALINFSNYRFYDGRLVVFPSPGSDENRKAMSLSLVNGVYRRGSSANNPDEAMEVARRVIKHYQERPDETLGVVTFSSAQAETVNDAVERLRDDHPELDEHFKGRGRLHDFFVKNLETVQGDERDKIIFSIGYGPDEYGKVYAQFGPINLENGWRRLNVAATRARREVEVVSSMTSDMIPSTNNVSVEHFRTYLAYAERGLPALGVDFGHHDKSPESPFEEAVAVVLSKWGYDIELQVGTAGYRVDIGIRHPYKPGKFLLGVECDGYQYHSAPAARDRDRLREGVLTGLGWRLHRIWGTAWYRSREAEEERLREAIEDALRSDDPPPSPRVPPKTEVVFVQQPVPDTFEWTVPYEKHSAKAQWGDYGAEEAWLRMMPVILDVVRIEGPIHMDLLKQRLRDAWEVRRIGQKIEKNLDEALSRLQSERTRPEDRLIREGDFLLLSLGHEVRVRVPHGNTERPIEWVHDSELKVAVRTLLEDAGSASREDLLANTARVFGWERTGGKISTVLNSVINELVKSGEITEADRVLTLAK
jgi:very-short-patch-repair endonuclease